MRSKRLALLAAGLGLTLAVSACGANQESPQSNDDQDTGIARQLDELLRLLGYVEQSEVRAQRQSSQNGST